MSENQPSRHDLTRATCPTKAGQEWVAEHHRFVVLEVWPRIGVVSVRRTDDSTGAQWASLELLNHDGTLVTPAFRLLG